jgi:DnaK suppressor protein
VPVAKGAAAKPSQAPAPSRGKTPDKSVVTTNVEAKTSIQRPPRAPARERKNLRPTLPGSAGARPANSPFRNFMQYEPRADEAYMSQEQLSHFRAILLRWRQELMEEVDRTVHHMRDEAANFPDPADRATQEEEFSIELRTRDRERKLIKKIDQTIERLDAGDFGYCDTCGVEIGLRRLEARPTATQCVDCKALDEIKERQLHG